MHYEATTTSTVDSPLTEDEAEFYVLDEVDLGEKIISIPGSPDGWTPPQPTAQFLGYQPTANSGTPAQIHQCGEV
jgi:hypothetical protein